MSPHQLEIILPDRRLSLNREGGDEDIMLSDWLASEGYPLNTRCGNRGLCRGCEIILPIGKSVKSCQTKLASLSGINQITIPSRSLKDQSLQGVSAFELFSDAAHEPRDGMGLALDIGTTTIAGALWDLQSGSCISTSSCANAQARYGDNVLTRIDKGTTPAGLCALYESLVQDSLRPLLAQLCGIAGCQSSNITEAVAAGNPAMLHTLAQRDLTGLSRYPFHPAFIDALSLPAQEHGLDFSCSLDLLPGMGAFVGADITAGAIATDFFQIKETTLLVDFGTNGEILLNAKGHCYATATAMGPAFEGGRLSCGAFAAKGVIASIGYDKGRWLLDCIGKTDTPKGISGAAYIDFIAVARKAGWLMPTGRFTDEAPNLQIAPNADAVSERRVYLTDAVFVSEADIAELLQAKAAIAAGIASLCDVAGIEANSIKTIYVAGGFGYHLNLASACAVGLLPVPNEGEIKVIGNSSLGGASLWLLCPAKRMLDSNWRGSIEYLELNQHPSFEDLYLDHLLLT